MLSYSSFSVAAVAALQPDLQCKALRALARHVQAREARLVISSMGLILGRPSSVVPAAREQIHNRALQA